MIIDKAAKSPYNNLGSISNHNADVAQWQSSAFVMRRLAVRLRSSAPLPPDIPEDFLYAVGGGFSLSGLWKNSIIKENNVKQRRAYGTKTQQRKPAGVSYLL